MKKFLLALAVSSMAASAMAADIIESQPEGTLYDMVCGSTERTFLIYNGMLASTGTDIGYKTEIVVNGQDVYIHNILRDYEYGDAWIKGTANADGIVEFAFPQTIYADSSNNIEVSVNMLKATTDGTTTTYVIDEADNTMRMRWDDWTLTQIKPGTSETNDGLVGLTNSADAYMGYGLVGLELSVVDTAPVALPADAETTETQYTCSFIDKNGDARKVSATVYRDVAGPDLWIAGLNQDDNKQIVHGTVNADGKIELESAQFMGITQGYFSYFYGGVKEGNDLSWTDKATLSFDGELIKADGILFINQGNKKPLLGFSLTDLVMTPLDAVVQTPANPIFPDEEGMEPEWSESEGMGGGYFFFDGLDVEGAALNPDNIFFNIYFDGVLQSYIINEEEVSDVPYNAMSDDAMFMGFGDGYYLLFWLEEIKTLGVQVIYHNRDEVTKSALVTYDCTTGEITTDGISDTVADAEVARVEYYNMQGVALAEPSGLCIRRTVYTDGTAKTEKIMHK